MPELLENLLESNSLIPGGYCYLWKPGLISLHIISDVLIAICDYSIPILLIYFVSKRQDVPLERVFLLFGAFMVACGTGHLMDVWTLWYSAYWLSGLVKAITAAISACIVFQLMSLIPLALKLPSPFRRQAAEPTLKKEKKETAEQVVAEEALQELPAPAETFEMGEDAIISVDEVMSIQLFNQGAENIFGYKAHEVLGKSLDLVLAAQLTEAHQQQVEKFTDVSTIEGQLWGNRKDGTKFPAEASIHQMELADETILTIILRNSGDRPAAGTVLRESEQQFRRIFEGAAIGVALIDRQGRFAQSNSALQVILGYSGEELSCMTFTDVTHPDDVAADLEFYQQLVAGKLHHYKMEKRYISSSGKVVWGRLTASLFEDKGEEPHIITMIEDITERKQAEEALRQSEEQLRQRTQQLEHTVQELQQTQAQLVQSEKMSGLGQLVAGVAHEINNPVNFIYGNLIHAGQYIQDLQQVMHLYSKHYPQPVSEIKQTMEEIDLDFILEDLPKLLASMKMGAVRIREIVLGLRNFSRIDEAEMKPVDIHEGIDNTLLLMQHRLKKAGYPSIQIIKDYGKLPPVECYAGQLNQVFMNLLTNAADALEEAMSKARDANGSYWFSATTLGGASGVDSCSLPTIRIRTEVIGSNQVMIRIADNGPGMTEEVRRKLFDPFFTTKPIGTATGLGLSISYQIVVEKHGGYLTCISTAGQGAEFIIQIPIRHQKVKYA